MKPRQHSKIAKAYYRLAVQAVRTGSSKEGQINTFKKSSCEQTVDWIIA